MSNHIPVAAVPARDYTNAADGTHCGTVTGTPFSRLCTIYADIAERVILSTRAVKSEGNIFLTRVTLKNFRAYKV